MPRLHDQLWLLSLLALTTGTSVYGGPARADGKDSSEPAPPAHVDRYGDPLPPGAIARLGTVRLRHTKPVGPITFAPDGKVLASGGRSIRIWDVTTGKQVRHLKCCSKVLAFSPDGRLLAATEEDKVRLFEVSTGRELCRRGGHAYFAEGVAFSPDGNLLASGDRGDTVHLWEVPTGKVVRKLKGHGGLVVGFSPDGKGVISSRPDGCYLLDVATGKVLLRWGGKVHLTAGLPAAALSPDGKLFALVGNDPQVRLYDAATGKELRVFALGQQHVMPPGQCVAFSPDGKLLAATEQMSNTVYAWDVATGKQLLRFQAGRVWAGQLAFSPDGKTLAVGAWNRIRLYDTASGKEVLPFGPFVGHEDTVWQFAFSPDGGTLASLGDKDDWLLLWDPVTGKEVRQLDLVGADAIAYSPDGKAVAAAGKGGVVRAWEPATGKVLRNWSRDGQNFRAITFSAENHLLAVGERENDLVLWDVTTGEARWRRRVRYSTDGPRFSSDGRALVYADDRGPVHIWEAESGRELDRVRASGWENSLASGGQRLLSIGEQSVSPDGKSWSARNNGMRLWTLAANQEPRACVLDTRKYDRATFSADGRVIVAGGGEDGESGVRLYEVASGKECGCFQGHEDSASVLAFSPNGRMLASGSYDQTWLVWDVTGLTETGRLPRLELARGTLQSCWDDLASPDALRAYRAIWKLVAGSGQAMPFLARHVRPASSPDARRIARLLAELDADQFAVRERATADLEELGGSAEPALSQALAGKPSPEARRRMQQILEKLGGFITDPQRLRTLRALMVLEQIGSPEARSVLKEVAQGPRGDTTTEAARASLRRLEGRSAPAP